MGVIFKHHLAILLTSFYVLVASIYVFAAAVAPPLFQKERLTRAPLTWTCGGRGTESPGTSRASRLGCTATKTTSAPWSRTSPTCKTSTCTSVSNVRTLSTYDALHNLLQTFSELFISMSVSPHNVAALKRSILFLLMFAQHTRISTSARSVGFCVIWVCISSSSSSSILHVSHFKLPSIDDQASTATL